MANIKRAGWRTNDKLFERLKRDKKSALSEECERHILDGLESTFNNRKYKFSYDREAQLNYQERWQLFQNNMIDSVVMTAHTLDGEDVRLEVNKRQFDQIYLDSVKHKEQQIKRLREDLYPLVDRAMSEKDLETITWDMSILTPEPETVKIKDDKLLNEEVKRLEMDTAKSTAEMMTLIFMSQMGM